ncbi:hypothetical protein [Sphingobium sp. WCS2017Hpa-17]|uniref:hypothetical protein n=1 Tax=Sphingobium sp. WCS2017Hpa-17 TaxID=3073638 RepID=UPI00288B8E79|nr:hypothetical protein [Sphingobium sp. WCS2017Hpa-17]
MNEDQTSPIFPIALAAVMWIVVFIIGSLSINKRAGGSIKPYSERYAALWATIVVTAFLFRELGYN